MSGKTQTLRWQWGSHGVRPLWGVGVGKTRQFDTKAASDTPEAGGQEERPPQALSRPSPRTRPVTPFPGRKPHTSPAGRSVFIPPSKYSRSF